MSKKQAKESFEKERGKFKRVLGLDRSRVGGGGAIRDLRVLLVLVRHSSKLAWPHITTN